VQRTRLGLIACRWARCSGRRVAETNASRQGSGIAFLAQGPVVCVGWRNPRPPDRTLSELQRAGWRSSAAGFTPTRSDRVFMMDRAIAWLWPDTKLEDVRLLCELVLELNRRGFGRLRCFPQWSPNGMSLRCSSACSSQAVVDRNCNGINVWARSCRCVLRFGR
jgi:hypothetical protein